VVESWVIQRKVIEMRFPLIKKVKIDGLNFIIRLEKNGELVFYRVSGFTKKGGYFNDKDKWGADVSPIEIFNDCDNPLKTIRIIVDEIIGLLNDHKPPFFFYSASENNRSNLYWNLFKKNSSRIPYEAVFLNEKNKVLFFKKKAQIT
jgi:hypothetical protein